MMTRDQPIQSIQPQPRPAPRDTLRTRIDVFDTTIRLTNYREDTATIRDVDPAELIDALTSQRRQTSPLLPPNTLWFSITPYGTAMAIWEPPRIRRVAMQFQPMHPPERLNVPMPGMVYICTPGRPPYIFASPDRPAQITDQLYHAPTFNTFADGRTCPGSNEYPLNHADIPESFWQSFFSYEGDEHGRSRSNYNDLWKHWQELHDQPEYPTDDLITAITVERAMRLP